MLGPAFILENTTALVSAGAVGTARRRFASNGGHCSSATASRTARASDDHLTQRELLVDILSANATRRDARQYLSRFEVPASKMHDRQKPKSAGNAAHVKPHRNYGIGVNLGKLYRPTRAIADTPLFLRQPSPEQSTLELSPSLHVALICLKDPHLLNDDTVTGLAQTISQLVKLDMRILMVIDVESELPLSPVTRRAQIAAQAYRLSSTFARYTSEASRFIDGALEVRGPRKGGVTVPDLIMEPLRRREIPVIPTVAYNGSGVLVDLNITEAMETLTQFFVDLPRPNGANASTLLDRIIVLDHIGGIPSRARANGSHIFINLEQEYEEIDKELTEYAELTPQKSRCKFRRHQQNLHLLQKCLKLLPSSSSALIISPQEAAVSSQSRNDQPASIQAGTRRQRNTLIHNLLTNKPMVSSSLPPARLRTTGSDETAAVSTSTATLLKWGMPLTIIPSPARTHGWTTPESGHTKLSLPNDSRIDFARLLHLIEDSFRRKLDTRHYLNRIDGRIAGIIVAGEYEGGAILTWEQPPGTSEPSRLVPYLDKFAVLQSSQGSSGVADILFQAMVRSCFPTGVCWRSRNDNPVNKWYFERAVGSWHIPGTHWTMFWTGEDVAMNETRFNDYVNVCRHIEPSFEGHRPE